MVFAVYAIQVAEWISVVAIEAKEKILTVYCERDTQKEGNTCVKCGGTWTAGTPLPACSAANSPAPSSIKLHCFPKAGGPFDLNTNPPSEKRYEICARCGNTWPHNGFPPSCPRDGVANQAIFLPLDGRTFTKDEIIESTGAVQTFKVPSSVLLDPTVRSLAHDEPFFLLRASDPLAGYLVEAWARNAESQGIDPKRVQGARVKAQEFRSWKQRKV